MITAVDTSFMLDVFLPDDRHGPRSLEALREAYNRGAIIVCEVVYAELVPGFDDRDALDDALNEISARISRVDTAIAYEAGSRWSLYRQAGGPRNRIITDFLIGSHAMVSADAFLTRDRGFYTTYFPELKLS